MINRMSKELLLPMDELEYLIASSPSRYKVFTIPKRQKNKRRKIAQPAREVKVLQRWVIKNILNKIEIHSASMAYVKNRSILDNANVHRVKPYLLKVDFKDFFPSIKAIDFENCISKNKNFIFSAEELQILSNILFRKPRRQSELELSIGAPSSPMISNIIMKELDEKIYSLCAGKNSIYTRYADDIVISTSDMPTRRDIYVALLEIIKKTESPRLTLNKQKTLFSSKANRRRVTGLIITNEGQVSLGREQKRKVSAMVHHFKTGQLDGKSINHLMGLVSFIQSVEPEFLERMKIKYGDDIIDKIKNNNLSV